MELKGIQKLRSFGFHGKCFQQSGNRKKKEKKHNKTSVEFVQAVRYQSIMKKQVVLLVYPESESERELFVLYRPVSTTYFFDDSNPANYSGFKYLMVNYHFSWNAH